MESPPTPPSLHDLVLRKTNVGVRLHVVGAARRPVLDVAEAQGSVAVLVSLELGDGRLRRVRVFETDYARASGAAAGFVLDFSLLDLADGREQLDKIFVARRPRQLYR